MGRSSSLVRLQRRCLVVELWHPGGQHLTANTSHLSGNDTNDSLQKAVGRITTGCFLISANYQLPAMVCNTPRSAAAIEADQLACPSAVTDALAEVCDD